jgi:hypothetical protein
VIQLVDKPYLFPQRCFFTGDGMEREIIDTGVQDTEGGRVYISLQFMDDLAVAAGYTSREEAARLEAENADLRRQVDAIPTILEGLSDAVRNLAASAVVDLLGSAFDGAVPVPEVGAEPAD